MGRAHAHGQVARLRRRGHGPLRAGLCRALSGQGHRVVEVGRPSRQLRRQSGKSDTVDAKAAARAVLAGQADGSPKSGDGEVETIRHLKVARDTAVKARTQAMVTLKAIGGQRAPGAARALHRRHRPDDLDPSPRSAAARRDLVDHGLGQGGVARARAALAGARRRDQGARRSPHDAGPPPCAGAGRGHPASSRARQPRCSSSSATTPSASARRPPSARALRRLPDPPASSGKTTRHRLDKGGNRQANAALHRVAITRTRCHPATIAHVRRRTAEGKSTREIRRCLKRHIAREVFQQLRKRTGSGLAAKPA